MKGNRLKEFGIKRKLRKIIQPYLDKFPHYELSEIIKIGKEPLTIDCLITLEYGSIDRNEGGDRFTSIILINENLTLDAPFEKVSHRGIEYSKVITNYRHHRYTKEYITVNNSICPAIVHTTIFSNYQSSGYNTHHDNYQAVLLLKEEE